MRYFTDVFPLTELISYSCYNLYCDNLIQNDIRVKPADSAASYSLVVKQTIEIMAITQVDKQTSHCDYMKDINMIGFVVNNEYHV